MAKAEIPPSLQESILATLAFDERWGSLIATQVTADNFDGQFREVSERILNYRAKFGKAPGRTHLDDLFAKTLADEGRSRASPLRRLLYQIVALEEGLNGEYVAKQASYFVRTQELKVRLIEASERFTQGDEGVVEDVQEILGKAIKAESDMAFDAGTLLSDAKRSLAFMDAPTIGTPIGIKELDWSRISLVPKEMLLYIAPKGSGKTWFCVHCGKQGLMHGDRVLHISLEVREEVLAERYYMSIFGAARTKEAFPRWALEFDKIGRLTGHRRTTIEPDFSWDTDDAKARLRAKIKTWGLRLGRIMVKEFPTRSLTIRRLVQYLDWLETVKRFIPTLLIVDYPDLMAVDRNNFRISLGQTFQELRGLVGERNMKLVVPTQGGRSSIGAKQVGSTNVSEDISKVWTADTVLTYSQTKAEKRMGLARIGTEHARTVSGGGEILISQAYDVGQYVRESAWLNQSHWDKMKQNTGTAPDGGPVEKEEEDE